MQRSLRLPLQLFDPYADDRTDPRPTRTSTNQTKAAAVISRVTFQATAPSQRQPQQPRQQLQQPRQHLTLASATEIASERGNIATSASGPSTTAASGNTSNSHSSSSASDAAGRIQPTESCTAASTTSASAHSRAAPASATATANRSTTTNCSQCATGSSSDGASLTFLHGL